MFSSGLYFDQSQEVLAIKLSTKGEYGVRAMLYLALKYGVGPISLEEISEEERISHQYLGQLFVKLRKSRLVKSTRGGKRWILSRSTALPDYPYRYPQSC
ncbi:Rrf2 family transcriptional regulator [Candidatus Hakubella thermalkaliphila]|uniref:Rrf2 family transcriptional regulator n=1 Tax=Candidatus Hakubella thermalkaliphila TaxID=2754717 RepID=UPI0021596C80|nr:Rrf2 family transcriptional regulator [Candidatus Hakubella thermalkaliphila]